MATCGLRATYKAVGLFVRFKRRAVFFTYFSMTAVVFLSGSLIVETGSLCLVRTGRMTVIITSNLAKRRSGAEADVVVRVRAGIVAIDGEHARIGGIVPIATADRQTLQPVPFCFYDSIECRCINRILPDYTLI